MAGTDHTQPAGFPGTSSRVEHRICSHDKGLKKQLQKRRVEGTSAVIQSTSPPSAGINYANPTPDGSFAVLKHQTFHRLSELRAGNRFANTPLNNRIRDRWFLGLPLRFAINPQWFWKDRQFRQTDSLVAKTSFYLWQAGQGHTESLKLWAPWEMGVIAW